MTSPRPLLIAAFVLFAFLGMWGSVRSLPVPTDPREVKFSEFLRMVEQDPAHFEPGQPVRIFTNSSPNSSFRGRLRDGTPFIAVGVFDRDVGEKLNQAGLRHEVIESPPPRPHSDPTSSLLGLLLLFGFYALMLRALRRGANPVVESLRAPPPRMDPDARSPVTFDDVAGVDEAKAELVEIVEFLRDPAKVTRLGGRIPKGVLLMGPPGTGKTLLAKAIAGEAGVPFFHMSGSGFVEMFVGVGAGRVRTLFAEAKKSAPCIVFIDEIDAVGRQRGTGIGGGHDEREQTLNQMLVEMDGFADNEGVIVIAATNRSDVLDPALLRPGRFDRRIVVAPPDRVGREEILRVHTKRTPLGADVDLSAIARGTAGLAGADLANLVNEAALHAARAGQNELHMRDFEAAKDKVLMGGERRSQFVNADDRRAAAYYQAGRAVVARSMKHADPVHKVTIVPRGQTVGLTQQLPVEDRTNVSKAEGEDQIAVYLAGRLAEELFLGRTTTSAAEDLRKANQIARQMVCSWGMSPKVGPLHLGHEAEDLFVGRELSFSHPRAYSNETAQLVDGEIRRILSEAQTRAREVLEQRRPAIKRVAQALLTSETLDAQDLTTLVDSPTIPTTSPLQG
ncbi:MAG TPA: ATP-dependent zinc metalloprotease FtsH [Polyangia bacterium]